VCSSDLTVRVGSRLFKDYQLKEDGAGNTIQTQIFGDPSLALLPHTISSGAYEYQIRVGEFATGVDEFIYIDPEVAIGYDFEVLSGPLFASVVLPDIGDGLYELWLPDSLSSGYTFNRFIMAGAAHIFNSSGISRFRILGIEVTAGLSPDDPTAFITGVTFTDPGIANVTQTPITIGVPEPAGSLLLAIGLLLLTNTRARSDRVHI